RGVGATASSTWNVHPVTGYRGSKYLNSCTTTREQCQAESRREADQRSPKLSIVLVNGFYTRLPAVRPQPTPVAWKTALPVLPLPPHARLAGSGPHHLG